jgi:hypothetical protein
MESHSFFPYEPATRARRLADPVTEAGDLGRYVCVYREAGKGRKKSDGQGTKSYTIIYPNPHHQDPVFCQNNPRPDSLVCPEYISPRMPTVSDVAGQAEDVPELPLSFSSLSFFCSAIVSLRKHIFSRRLSCVYHLQSSRKLQQGTLRRYATIPSDPLHCPQDSVRQANPNEDAWAQSRTELVQTTDGGGWESGSSWEPKHHSWRGDGSYLGSSGDRCSTVHTVG